MTGQASPFRKEALDFQTGQDGQGSPLRVDPPWTRRLYWAVLVLAVAAVLATMVVRTEETTTGPALVDAETRTFVALVPDATAPRRGARVRLELDRPEDRSSAGQVTHVEVADAARARKAGFGSPSGPMLLVRGALTDQPGTGSVSRTRQEATAVVVLRFDTIFHLLLRQGRGMFGGP